MQTISYSGNDSNHGPLIGLRILDLSMLLPGPLCSMHLADLGAEVIKIEHPVAVDGTRKLGTPLRSGSHEMSAYFYVLNRNKKSITLNYRRPRGKELLIRLLEKADVLLEGFRPGTMDEMGLGYTSLRSRFPGLIYCAISGYGATGPDRNRAGHDANYMAGTGLLNMTGTTDDPILPGMQVADITGGTLLALSGILAALYTRERTGRGNFVDTGMMDGAFSIMSLQAGEFLATQNSPERTSMPLSGALPNYHIYRVRDGRHVVLAALEGPFFQVFLRQIDRQDLLERMRSHEFALVRAELEAFFMGRTLAELSHLFDHTETCLSPVLTLEEAFANPQLQDRHAIVEIEDRRFGCIRVPGSPFHLSETPVSYRHAPPEPGEHNSVIYSEIGIDEHSLEDLRRKRIV